MKKSLKEIRKNPAGEKHSVAGALLKEFILGGQDGLVNVLGIILGIAVATKDIRMILISGLAATFAESFSMAAVAYTSARAEEDHYRSQKRIETLEIKNFPAFEKNEVRNMYYKKGFRGALLKKIVAKITSSKKMWLDIMMKEELELSNKFLNPLKSGITVGASSIIGSIIPLLPFFFFQVSNAIIYSVALSAVALFITGAVEAKITVGSWAKKGVQLMAIGMSAALIGFIIGKLLGVSI